MNGCPCEAWADGWRCVVHGWSVVPGTAMGKPDLTSGGLRLAVMSGGVPCAMPAHAAADRGLGRGTAMQKPDLTSCGHEHDVSGSDLVGWRRVHGACVKQAGGGAYAEGQEKNACGISSPCDEVCDAVP